LGIVEIISSESKCLGKNRWVPPELGAGGKFIRSLSNAMNSIYAMDNLDYADYVLNSYKSFG
jgi:hypothetical protein